MSHEKNFRKIKYLKVKDACVENLNAKNLMANSAFIQNLNATTLNGKEICQSGSENLGNPFDCMDCNITEDAPYGNPIKPDDIDQRIWDFLMCNLKEYQAQLQADFRAGRDQIRCIKKAYGCAPSCPPDCPPIKTKGCTGPCPGDPGTTGCFVAPECIPDPLTCEQDVPNFLYATSTILPFRPFSVSDCNSELEKLTSFTCDLNINNTSCNLATRVCTILVQFAFIADTPGPTGPTGPTGSTGTRCPVCPGSTGSAGLPCLCKIVEPDIACGIIQVSCRQFGATININLGEHFEINVLIPTVLVETIFNTSSKTGAFQMAVFLEDGLEVSNNKFSRGTDAVADRIDALVASGYEGPFGGTG